ncbi:hypothetical protein WJX73_010867 [Symbiochloris irregularis]|uniref:DUF1206 domain-containing protein n=1 Tax=Symbiochloris irregularis TaxID=706552 RepID=A0AAW1P566_9CHLO
MVAGIPTMPTSREWKKQFSFFSPAQVSQHHYRWVKILGGVGWCTKGFVYGTVGALACHSAVAKHVKGSISPQGAFILVGSNEQLGVPLLVLMLLAMLTYCSWRFWECYAGQGSDAANSNFRNFFRYRLSPFVSGVVYLAYAAFIAYLIPKSRQELSQAADSSFPQSWTHDAAGKAGLCIFGIAFLAACLVQLEGSFTKNFHETLKPDLRPLLRWPVLIAGHIGFCARGGVFLSIAILFFRAVQQSGLSKSESDKSFFGDALQQLKHSKWGKAILFLLGFGLLIYALFAVMNGVYAREFPTRIPSGNPHRRKGKETSSTAPSASLDSPTLEGIAMGNVKDGSLKEIGWERKLSLKRNRPTHDVEADPLEQADLL